MAEPPNSAPLFSVVIPAFNSGRWIGEAVKSALAQGRDDLEIVVVDDGSTDNTLAEMQPFEDRVRLLRQPNAGAAAARNRGIAAAAGSWIAFLDADDRWRPGHLDRLEEVIRLRPEAALVYAAAMVIDASGRELKPKPAPDLGADPFRALLLANTITTSAAAAKRSALLRVGAFFPGLQVGEDWDLWLRLARAGAVVRLPLVTVEYRRQESGLIHTRGLRLREQNLTVIARAAAMAPELDARTLRRARAHCYLESAVRLLAAEETTLARAELAAATREAPGLARAWLLRALTLGGPPAARLLKSLWRRRERPRPPRPAAPERPLRVDYLITDSGAGGAEKMLTALVTRLDPARFRARVIVLKPPGRRAEEIARAGLPVLALGLPARLGPAYAAALPGAALRLYRALRADPPDLLHCWLFQANLLGRVVGRLARVPAILSSLRVMEAERLYQYPLDRLTRGLVDRYLAVSTGTAMLYARRLRLPPAKLFVIPNGIETEGFRIVERDGARRALGLAADAPVIGVLGRLHRQKGIDLLLAALPGLSARFPNLVVLVAGDGPERRRLEAKARVLAVGPRVRFLGEWERPEEFLAALDLLALPSRWEGMPNTVLEAMAAGLPVVAARAGAVPELVVGGLTETATAGETGLVVPLEDVGALARALEALLADPARARAMGEAGRRRVAARYALSRMVAEHERLYRELASTPLPPVLPARSGPGRQGESG